MVVAKSLEEVKEKFNPITVSEEEEFFWVLTDRKKGFFKVLKPRTLEQVQERLRQGGFPERYIKLLERIEETQAIKQARDIDKGLLFWGPAGTGKTTACVWKIGKLIQFQQAHSPLYVSAFDYEYEKISVAKNSSDAILIDDLNTKALHPQRLNFLLELIYHAHAQEKYLFVTTNESKMEIPEPVISRIEEMCRVVRIDGEDLRKKITYNRLNSV